MRSLFFFGALFGLMVFGCSDNAGPGEPCSVKEDCADGYQCINQICVGDSPDSGISSGLVCQLVCEKVEDCGFNGEGFISCDDTRCVECKTDDDCNNKTGRLKHCRTPDCVECTEDAHCENTTLKTCDTNLNRCVKCKTNADCYTEEGKKIGTGRCREQDCFGCIGDLECLKTADIGSRVLCVDQICSDCASHDDCPLVAGEGLLGTSVCDENTHSCIGCANDQQCNEAIGLGDGKRSCLPY